MEIKEIGTPSLSRFRYRRECFGDGVAGQATGTILYGRADGWTAGGATHGEGKAAFNGG